MFRVCKIRLNLKINLCHVLIISHIHLRSGALLRGQMNNSLCLTSFLFGNLLRWRTHLPSKAWLLGIVWRIAWLVGNQEILVVEIECIIFYTWCEVISRRCLFVFFGLRGEKACRVHDFYLLRSPESLLHSIEIEYAIITIQILSVLNRIWKPVGMDLHSTLVRKLYSIWSYVYQNICKARLIKEEFFRKWFLIHKHSQLDILLSCLNGMHLVNFGEKLSYIIRLYIEL